MQKEYDITIDNDEGKYAGSIFGYVADEIHYLENFLEENGYGDVKTSEYKNSKYGIICNLFVEESDRNSGLGYELMNDLMYKFCEGHHVDYIFLVSDGLESNDFNLQKWYESWGFEVLEDRDKCPLMINYC